MTWQRFHHNVATARLRLHLLLTSSLQPLEIIVLSGLVAPWLTYLGYGGMGETQVVQGGESCIARRDDVGGEGEGGREAGEDRGGGGGGEGGEEAAWIRRFRQLVRGWQQVHWYLTDWGLNFDFLLLRLEP